mmetsp:Transcript_46820/g.85743  ORF Transcript_46820/g.85743 Transcript_46820/m.85743 type:complete len:320 (+) Transcript_46820:314-1273(+)
MKNHSTIKPIRNNGSTKKRRGQRLHRLCWRMAGSKSASWTSLAKSCVRNRSPSSLSAGCTACPQPPCTICASFCLAPAVSSKSTRKEFSPSLTNSKCPCAGCTATGAPEHHASMTTLPSVSKLLADTKTSHAAKAVRSSSACSIFLNGSTLSLREDSIKSAYSEVLSPTITSAQPSGMQCIRRCILFSEDHLLADKKMAFGSKPSNLIHLARSTAACSAKSSKGLLNTGDHRITGHTAWTGVPYRKRNVSAKTCDTDACTATTRAAAKCKRHANFAVTPLYVARWVMSVCVVVMEGMPNALVSRRATNRNGTSSMMHKS